MKIKYLLSPKKKVIPESECVYRDRLPVFVLSCDSNANCESHMLTATKHLTPSACTSVWLKNKKPLWRRSGREVERHMSKDMFWQSNIKCSETLSSIRHAQIRSAYMHLPEEKNSFTNTTVQSQVWIQPDHWIYISWCKSFYGFLKILQDILQSGCWD